LNDAVKLDARIEQGAERSRLCYRMDGDGSKSNNFAGSFRSQWTKRPRAGVDTLTTGSYYLDTVSVNVPMTASLKFL